MKIRGNKYQVVFWPICYFSITDDGLYRIDIDPPRFGFSRPCQNRIFQWSFSFLWIEFRKYCDEFFKKYS